ncbi:hypothetical protein DPMN_039813 [Dreissena polymorpha]|uniref:Uncharacterized protein n=1 Tax=Dreissena polymorpha TaxID=45954 RepID=A0A9D4HUE0_DREPO|nr:hypothetical protein DPMN_039813 [Dreissena polymorpha]
MMMVNEYDLDMDNDDAFAAGSAADDDGTAKMIILELSNFGILYSSTLDWVSPSTIFKTNASKTHSSQSIEREVDSVTYLGIILDNHGGSDAYIAKEYLDIKTDWRHHQDKRKRGRPRNTWRRDLDTDAKQICKTRGSWRDSPRTETPG